MCEPVSIITATAAVAGAYSQRQQGKYNQRVAEVNAALAEESAQDAVARGAAEESRYRVQAGQFKGEQRAAIAASGVEASGSALRLLSDTAAISELDALTIRNNAAREAFGFRTQGLSYRMQGQLDRSAGRLGAAGTILGGAAQSFGAYRQFG